ncbi:hypothetical protein O9993_15990 [Vibrio lentus]|nr:hypothetical protein [Vibrio lentus]
MNHCKSDSASLISVNDVKKSPEASVDVVIPFLPNHFLSKSSLGQPAHKGNRKVKLAFNSLLEPVTASRKQGSRRFGKRGA